MLYVSTPLMAAKSFKSKSEADCYLNARYQQAFQYYGEKKWKKASTEFEKLVYFFPDTEMAAESYFYLGVCYFEMKELDFANLEFTNYLKASEHPKLFEETIYYKFYIAEHFRTGGKKRCFTFRYTPKLACGLATSLAIYDEIIATVPNHEYAAASLYSKGNLLHAEKEYRDSIEAFQTLIRRFPRHELTPQTYLSIAQIYCELSRIEFQNPDILALSEINVRKFKEEFPRDEKVEMAEGYVRKIKENYAKGLSDIGRFYERVGVPTASVIYYQSSIEEFPSTHIADFCRGRLQALGIENTEESEEEAQEVLAPQAEESAPLEAPSSSLEAASLSEEAPAVGNEANE